MKSNTNGRTARAEAQRLCEGAEEGVQVPDGLRNEWGGEAKEGKEVLHVVALLCMFPDVLLLRHSNSGFSCK